MDYQGTEAAYQAALDEGQFIIQQCNGCQRHIFYPRQICPHCGNWGLKWVESCGTGTIYSTTTVRRASDAGGDLNVSLIDLDEGVRMMSRVEGIAPHQVRIGMRVVARVIDKDGRGLVTFEPLDAGP